MTSIHFVSTTTVIHSFYISFVCLLPPLCGHQGFCSSPLWFRCASLSSLFTWHERVAVSRPNVANVSSFGGPRGFTKEAINMAQRGEGIVTWSGLPLDICRYFIITPVFCVYSQAGWCEDIHEDAPGPKPSSGESHQMVWLLMVDTEVFRWRESC